MAPALLLCLRVRSADRGRYKRKGEPSPEETLSNLLNQLQVIDTYLLCDHFRPSFSSCIFLAFAAAATAAVVKINVGQSGLTYTPDTVKADIGDVLEFKFVGGTHDVISGDFSKPCQPGPAAGGFGSNVAQGSPAT